jgi:HPt (histidine-containing phosphotransfer) domain-containing protein
MDDFVSKPFSVGKLRSALERWTRIADIKAQAIAQLVVQPKKSSLPPAAAPSLTPAHAAGLDQGALDQIRALRRPGRPNLLLRLLDDYLETTPKRMSELQDAVAKADLKLAGNIAHSLKSISATLGASVFARSLGRLEEASRTGALEAARAEVSRARTEYDHIHGELIALQRGERGAEAVKHA